MLEYDSFWKGTKSSCLLNISYFSEWVYQTLRTPVIFQQTFLYPVPYYPALTLFHFNHLSCFNLTGTLFNKSSTLQQQDNIRVFPLYFFSYIIGQLGILFCFCFVLPIICFIIFQVYFVAFVIFKFGLLMFSFLKLFSLFLKLLYFQSSLSQEFLVYFLLSL